MKVSYALVTSFLPMQQGQGIGCPVLGWSAGTALKPSVRTATVCGQGTKPRPRHCGQVLSSISPTSRRVGVAVSILFLSAGSALELNARVGRKKTTAGRWARPLVDIQRGFHSARPGSAATAGRDQATETEQCGRSGCWGKSNVIDVDAVGDAIDCTSRELEAEDERVSTCC